MPSKYIETNALNMYSHTLKLILIALQDQNTSKATDHCTNALKCLNKLEKIEKVKQKAKDCL